MNFYTDLDHKSDALTTTLSSHLQCCNIVRALLSNEPDGPLTQGTRASGGRPRATPNVGIEYRITIVEFST